VQEKLGDLEGARVTRALLPPPSVRAWLDLALSVSANWSASAVDLKIAQARKREAKYVPSSLAEIGREMGIALLTIRTVERDGGQTAESLRR